jgi:hypothetical protein
VQDANRIEYGVDALGRKLGVARLTTSVRRRVIKAISAEQGQKDGYFTLAATACCCVSIDGAPVPFPGSELQIDALIDRLESEGLDCILSVMMQHFPVKSEESLKNS